MNEEELMKVVEDDFTVDMYWNLFDRHQEWFVKSVFIPYFLNTIRDENLIKSLRDSLPNKSDVEWTLD
jgi:hypothetical protein